VDVGADAAGPTRRRARAGAVATAGRGARMFRSP
jgi:hypothetical protein